MKVLVTGADGYIGLNLVPALHARGHSVIAVDRGSNSFSRRLDITDEKGVRELLESEAPDALVHLAAMKDVVESTRIPLEYERVNAHAFEGLLRQISDLGLSTRVVLISTAAVYNSRGLPLHETRDVNPPNPYGVSKLLAENALEKFPGRGVALRLFNVIGGHRKNQQSGSVISRILEATESKPFRVFGTSFDTADGTAERDYVHVADVCDAIMSALENEWPYDVVNVGTGGATTVRQLVAEIEKQLGHSLPVENERAREGEVATAIADIERLRTTGWKPRVSLETAVRDEIAHFNGTCQDCFPIR